VFVIVSVAVILIDAMVRWRRPRTAA
jgi:hypothetical protein